MTLQGQFELLFSAQGALAVFKLPLKFSSTHVIFKYQVTSLCVENIECPCPVMRVSCYFCVYTIQQLGHLMSSAARREKLTLQHWGRVLAERMVTHSLHVLTLYCWIGYIYVVLIDIVASLCLYMWMVNLIFIPNLRSLESCFFSPQNLATSENNLIA